VNVVVTATNLLDHLRTAAPMFVWPLERFFRDTGTTPYEVGQTTPALLSTVRGIGPQALHVYATALRRLGVPMRQEWTDYGDQ